MKYTLSPNGIVCGSTITMTMSGSQTGVNYQLSNPALGVLSNPVAGTGSAITWNNINVIPNVAYTVTATAGTCTSTVVATSTVNYETLGGSITTPNGTTVCGSNSINLTIQPSTPGTDYTYQWFVNGAPQNNSNVQTYTVTQPGTYFAVMHNTCSGITLPTVTISSGAGVSNLNISGSENVATGVVSTVYTASASNVSGGYSWSISPAAAGTISANGGSATINWSTSFSGTANISVTAGGCDNTQASANYLVGYNIGANNYNYVQETDVRTQNITTANALPSLGIGQKDVSLNYYDGLGRIIQKVSQSASVTAKDIVQPIAYDQFGRVANKYLPYSATLTAGDGSYKINATYDQASFYNNPTTIWSAPGVVTINTVNNIAPTYGQSIYEASPLNRVIEQGFPGAAWQPANSQIPTSGHTLKIAYSVNDQTSTFLNTNTNGSRVVNLYYTVINASTQTQRLVLNGTYPPGQLYVTTTRSENWQAADGCVGTTEEYKDKSGHLILKRKYNINNGLVQMLSTYYVYDNYDNLAFVLSPAASPDASTTPAQNILDNLCYQYQYDQRNRTVGKKIPGKGWEYMIYNVIDQIIATQDSSQRSLSPQQVSYKKYDATGRVIQTGYYTVTGSAPLVNLRASLQSQANAQTNLWETRASGSPYTNLTIPTSGATALVTNYYDNYNIPALPSIYTTPVGATSMTRSLPTATITAMLNTPADALWQVYYYDNFGRVMETYKQHYLGGVVNVFNYDVIRNTYDFSNDLLSSVRSHYILNNNAAKLNVTINNNYIYDNQGRKVQSQEQIGTGPNITLSDLQFNEVGQLYQKYIHGNGNGGQPDGTDITLNNSVIVGSPETVIASHSITLNPNFVAPAGSVFSAQISSYLETYTYAYNERGWLQSCSSPLFNMQLMYNTGTVPQYNGNVANQTWSSSASSGTFAYSYDKLSRLIGGSTTDNKYGESGINYDLNGNISGLTRTYNNVAIDNLTYNYINNSNSQTNQLQNINDQATDPSSNGYKTGTWTYSYDANGNMISDNSKGITGPHGIIYNIVNQPQTVTLPNPTGGGNYTITYIYDANGRKLRRVNTQGTGSSTDYIDGIQYDATSTNAPTITFIRTDEGRILNITGTPNYEYNLTDQLGNSRVTFDTGTGTAAIQQQDNYLPFGMDISVGNIGSPQNYYLYNNKEFQSGWGTYDYGARFYDPVTARWSVVDPDAEQNRMFSPYNYCVNNPLRNIDPDGRQWVWNSQTGAFYWNPTAVSAKTAGDHEVFIGVNYLYTGDNGERSFLAADGQNYNSTMMENQSTYRDWSFNPENYEPLDETDQANPVGHIVPKSAPKAERMDSFGLWASGYLADFGTGLAQVARSEGTEGVFGPVGIILGGGPALINIINGVGTPNDYYTLALATASTITTVSPAGPLVDAGLTILSLINDANNAPKPTTQDNTVPVGGYPVDDNNAEFKSSGSDDSSTSPPANSSSNGNEDDSGGN